MSYYRIEEDSYSRHLKWYRFIEKRGFYFEQQEPLEFPQSPGGKTFF